MVRYTHKRNLWLIAGLALLPELAGGQNMSELRKTGADARRGELLVIDSEKGNCIICHEMPRNDLPADTFGNIGPSLVGVGSRYTAKDLRSKIADPKASNPESLMPAYSSTDNLNFVQKRYAGAPILTAQEIDDVVEYLLTLK